MTRVEGLRLMAKAAHLDFERGVSEAEITAQLDASQAAMSVLPKPVLNRNILQVSVTSTADFCADLGDKRQQQSNLTEVIIDTAAHHDQQINRALGIASAFSLKRRENIILPSWSASRRLDEHLLTHPFLQRHW